MADTIREQILLTIKSELENITVLNGFQQDVGKVYRGHETAIQVDEIIAIIFLDRGDVQKRHLRGTYENRMGLEIRAVFREDDDAKRVASLNRLAGDIEKRMKQDETHGGLAIKTFLQLRTVVLGEANDPLGSHVVTAEILYRVKRRDSFTQTNI